MGSTLNVRKDYITKTRQAATDFLEAYEELKRLSGIYGAGMRQWIVNSNGSDPAASNYVPGDFAGDNEGLRVNDLTALLETSLASLDTYMTANRSSFENVRL